MLTAMIGYAERRIDASHLRTGSWRHDITRWIRAGSGDDLAVQRWQFAGQSDDPGAGTALITELVKLLRDSVSGPI